jgi:L-xylulokinase
MSLIKTEGTEMKKEYFIGLDNGGSVTKAGLFDVEGKEIAVSSISVEPHIPKMNCVERDSDELFMANIRCIKEVLAKSAIDPADIKGLAVSGHGNGLYLVGFDGKPTYQGVISTDTRSAGIVRQWYKTGVFDKVLPITNQNIWAGQLSPLLAWFRENEKETLARSQYAFPCTDYVRFRLTGEAYGEITSMSATNLVNLQTKEYDDEVLRLFGLAEYKRLLPPIRLSHEICGGITKEVAGLTGLMEGTPVMGGMVDFCACPLATGVIDEDKLSVTTGTWSINLYLSRTPIIHKDLLMTSLYAMNDLFLIMEGSMTSASNLEWFVRKIMAKEAEEATREGWNIYQLCNELVGSVQPEDCSVIFLPFLYGTNVDADAKSCFMGLSYYHEKAHLLRAIYEGVVFSAMMHIEKLLGFRESMPKAVRISGGASRSKEWVQIFADVLQLPIEVSDAKELGTMGVAMCAAVGTGAIENYEEAVLRFVKIKYICQPNAEKKAIYRKKYELYKKLVGNMEKLWEQWKLIAD